MGASFDASLRARGCAYRCMFTLQRVSEILLRACVHEECLIRVREM
jgi:hypothetical protein